MFSLPIIIFKIFIYFAALGLSCGMWDLVLGPGIEPWPPALGAQSLSWWTTREVLKIIFKTISHIIWQNYSHPHLSSRSLWKAPPRSPDNYLHFGDQGPPAHPGWEPAHLNFMPAISPNYLSVWKLITNGLTGCLWTFGFNFVTPTRC